MLHNCRDDSQGHRKAGFCHAHQKAHARYSKQNWENPFAYRTRSLMSYEAPDEMDSAIGCVRVSGLEGWWYSTYV